MACGLLAAVGNELGLKRQLKCHYLWGLSTGDQIAKGEEGSVKENSSWSHGHWFSVEYHDSRDGLCNTMTEERRLASTLTRARTTFLHIAGRFSSARSQSLIDKGFLGTWETTHNMLAYRATSSLPTSPIAWVSIYWSKALWWELDGLGDSVLSVESSSTWGREVLFL